MSGRAILRGKYAAGRYLAANDAPRELIRIIAMRFFSKPAESRYCAAFNRPTSI